MGKTEVAADAVAVVSRQFFTKGAPDGDAEDQELLISVHRFVTRPASIAYEVGSTLNMGNYESARVSVRVEVPCYREELDGALGYAKEFAERVLGQEVEEIHKARKSGKKDLF